ncbi:MAG: FAD-binding oxidoreductase [SAR324 cluster bacterium]|nr:FAD-binding oxidoreductase [SAR324 cluster bacterium]
MTASPSPVQQVERLLGAPLVASTPERLAAFALDGHGPALVAFPETPEQVAQLLALANSEGWAVVPWGGGHGMATGATPARYDVALSLARLETLLDHDADNLTLTGEAGLVLDEANRRLAEVRQILPLGLPGDRGSLGGIVAAARPVPKRLLYGDVRDMLIGIRVALPDGSLVRYGRKVIKNVAGYDMNKLFLGSQGLLGVIVEATFKLFALPDEERYVTGAFADLASAAAAAGALLGSALLPATLLLFDGNLGEAFLGAARLPRCGGQALLLAGFEGRSATLRRQEERARELIADQGGQCATVAGALPEEACAFLRLPTPARADAAALRLRLGVTPQGIVPTVTRLRESLAELELEAAVMADYGSGTLRIVLPWPGDQAAQTCAAWIEAMRAALMEERGYLLIEAAPPALKARSHVWGDLEGEAEIMALIKSRLDPKGILAPGRFLALP